MEARVKTAALMGFKMILGPPLQPFEADLLLAMAKEISGAPEGDGQKVQRERYYGVATLEDAFELLQGFDDIAPVAAPVAVVKKEERGTLLKLIPKSEKEKDP